MNDQFGSVFDFTFAGEEEKKVTNLKRSSFIFQKDDVDHVSCTLNFKEDWHHNLSKCDFQSRIDDINGPWREGHYAIGLGLVAVGLGLQKHCIIKLYPACKF